MLLLAIPILVQVYFNSGLVYGAMRFFHVQHNVATPGALDALTRAGQNPVLLLKRHRSGDWGELDADDRVANDAAVEGGGRVLSAYKLKNGARLWVITEADRAVTTLLLPDEY